MKTTYICVLCLVIIRFEILDRFCKLFNKIKCFLIDNFFKTHIYFIFDDDFKFNSNILKRKIYYTQVQQIRVTPIVFWGGKPIALICDSNAIFVYFDRCQLYLNDIYYRSQLPVNLIEMSLSHKKCAQVIALMAEVIDVSRSTVQRARHREANSKAMRFCLFKNPAEPSHYLNLISTTSPGGSWSPSKQVDRKAKITRRSYIMEACQGLNSFK